VILSIIGFEKSEEKEINVISFLTIVEFNSDSLNVGKSTPWTKIILFDYIKKKFVFYIKHIHVAFNQGLRVLINSNAFVTILSVFWLLG
jgi:hypothetical protein